MTHADTNFVAQRLQSRLGLAARRLSSACAANSMPVETPADQMFALRDALYVTSDAWGKEELHGIPWQCGGDAVFTPAVPVAQECTVHFRLRSMGLPAGVGAAHVWIKQGAAEFSHVGTLASASSRCLACFTLSRSVG